MFELDAVKQEESNPRGKLIAGGLAIIALSLIGAVFYIAVSKPKSAPALPNAMHAGTAEFDSYKDKVSLEVIEKIVHPNLVGMKQYEVQARVTNLGDRTLTGIELAGKMIDLSDNLIKESLSFPIPRARTEPLKPGESMKVSVKIDGPGKVSEDDIKDLLVELRGLQF
jgi:hypothetical protein